MTRTLLWLLASSWLLACQPTAPPSPVADLILTGGPIYTAHDAQPQAEAVAVRNGRILYVGNAEGVGRFRGPTTRTLDLKGQTLTPGFIESHAHLLNLGYARLELDLTTTASYAELVARVDSAARAAAPGTWITGRGWHQSKWQADSADWVGGFPTHTDLSAISPDNPVWLVHASGHAALANAAAMQVAGIGATTDAGPGGELIRDAREQPTGLFNEAAMQLVQPYLPARTPARDRQALDLAFAECLAHGLTAFHDAGVDQATLDLYQQLRDDEALPLRLYAMLAGSDDALLQRWQARGPLRDSTHWLTVRAIKLYADGALGSRGAWLLDPYADAPGHVGMPVTPVAEVAQKTAAGLAAGFQLCVHAIGDRANRQVLDLYEAAFRQHPEAARDARFRIEHAQHLHPDDLPRFAALGVIPSMQTIHFASDRPWAMGRLGQARIEAGAYMWQSLVQSGARLINGTDAPVEPISPVACFYAAVTRRTLAGTPPGGYEPQQRLTRAQALRAYTLDAAYAAFADTALGSIEVGKCADFTVFSQDIMTVPDEELLRTQVRYTIVDGVVRYGE